MNEPSTRSLKSTDELQKFGLFSSRGLRLPIEICLKLVEDVISTDPECGLLALTKLSKGFNALLRSYEHSIVRRILRSEDTAKLYPAMLLSSWPRNTRISADTYPWLCEVRRRRETIDSLIGHEITRMVSCVDGHILIDLPNPGNTPESGFSKRLEIFKRNGLGLLYGIADSTAGLDISDIHVIRARQCAYLESLTTTQLAILGVITRVLGLSNFRMTKNTIPRKSLGALREHWLVFEDRVLKHGPFFALATVSPNNEIHEWSNTVIADALDDMEAFETGQVEGYASLQGVLWRRFHARVECNAFDGWEEALQRVEADMMAYKLSDEKEMDK